MKPGYQSVAASRIANECPRFHGSRQFLDRTPPLGTEGGINQHAHREVGVLRPAHVGAPPLKGCERHLSRPCNRHAARTESECRGSATIHRPKSGPVAPAESRTDRATGSVRRRPAPRGDRDPTEYPAKKNVAIAVDSILLRVRSPFRCTGSTIVQIYRRVNVQRIFSIHQSSE